MTAFAAFTLPADGNNIALSPVTIDKEGVALYMSDEENFDARVRVTHQLRLPNSQSKLARTKLKVVVPLIDSTTQAVKGEMYANIEFVVPKNTSVAERSDLRALANALLGRAEVSNSVLFFQSVR